MSVMIVSRAKTAELIEMSFGLWTRVGTRKHVLDGTRGSRSPHATGHFSIVKYSDSLP